MRLSKLKLRARDAVSGSNERVGDGSSVEGGSAVDGGTAVDDGAPLDDDAPLENGALVDDGAVVDRALVDEGAPLDDGTPDETATLFSDAPVANGVEHIFGGDPIEGWDAYGDSVRLWSWAESEVWLANYSSKSKFCFKYKPNLNLILKIYYFRSYEFWRCINCRCK